METITGTLKRVFSERGNWFAGLLLTESGEEISINGVAVDKPSVDCDLELSGEFKENPKYGLQFRFESCATSLPTTREGTLRVLQTLPGIGPQRALQLWEALGAETVYILLNEPERLREVKGLGSWADQSIDDLKSRRDNIEIERDLCEFSFGPKTREKIIEHFQPTERLAKVLRIDPYRLVAIDRVSFRQVDGALMRMKRFPADSPKRAAAAIAQALKDAADKSGHTYLPREMVGDALGALRLTNPIPADVIPAGVGYGIDKELFVSVSNDGGLALKRFSDAEELIARRIKEIQRTRPELLTPLNPVPNDIAEMLTNEQASLINHLENSGVAILTGGPGTGKTFSTQAAIEAIGRPELVLLAPTGKAARRASEVTGFDASTIHRFAYGLEHAQEMGEEPPQPRAIVIDEMSMVDVEIFSLLLKVVSRSDIRLLLVGDVDQLPPVGPGSVLRDLISSGSVPVVRLTKVMRQAEKSTIVKNAHLINKGVVPSFKKGLDDWFSILGDPEGKDKEALAARLVQGVIKAREKWGLCPYKDMMVLAPMHKGELGVANLNDQIRKAFNPPLKSKKELVDKFKSFRVGDKVIVTRNDYKLGVVNGDMGKIIDIRQYGEETNDKGEKLPAALMVSVDGNGIITFEGEDMNLVRQAWAMTIHKSQGSEYKCVFIALHHSVFKGLLTRQLVYTGITRVKQKIVVVGTAKGISMGVRNNAPSDRKTRLERLLK